MNERAAFEEAVDDLIMEAQEATRDFGVPVTQTEINAARQQVLQLYDEKECTVEGGEGHNVE